MKIIIIVYIAMGILSILVGPIANRIKRDIIDLKLKLNLKAYAGIKTASKRRILWFEIVYRLLIVLCYPLFYIILFNDNLRSKKTDKDKTSDITDNNLHFFFCGGAGLITCGDCGFNEKIVGFLHGLDDGEGTLTGYQCQQCGRFHELNSTLTIPEGKKCECGGDLSRDKPLFCPSCKSKKVSYRCTFMT
jgi:hypothetical protein